MEKYDLLKGNIAVLLLVCFLTTITTFAATAYTVKAVMHWQNRGAKS